MVRFRTKRAKGYNWADIVPGNTLKTLWKETYDIEDLPQVLQPKSGYIYNANHTPFKSSADADNPNQAEFDIARFDQQFRQAEGTVAVSLSKSGVVVGSGSAARIAMANAMEAQMQRNVTQYNADIGTSRKMEEANFSRIAGKMARQQARLAQISTIANTGTSLLKMNPAKTKDQTRKRKMRRLMPQIPTFTSQARPTAEVGSVKSNLQVPLSQTLAGALQPVTNLIVEKQIQENEIQNKTQALKLENEYNIAMKNVTQEIITNPDYGDNQETAQTYYKNKQS